MTYEELMQIKNGIDKAESSDEPFLFADDELKVIGNPNKTEVKKYDYKLVFETEEGKKVERVFENVHITPRKRLDVVRLLVKMMPYFRKAKADGTVDEYDDIETAELFLGMDDSIYDAMYDLAVTVLDLPNEIRDWIDPISVLAFGVKLILDNPAVVREAEMSFD